MLEKIFEIRFADARIGKFYGMLATFYEICCVLPHDFGRCHRARAYNTRGIGVSPKPGIFYVEMPDCCKI
jgi:hypothetical protein